MEQSKTIYCLAHSWKHQVEIKVDVHWVDTIKQQGWVGSTIVDLLLTHTTNKYVEDLNGKEDELFTLHSSTFFSWVNSGGTDFEFSNGDDKAICDFNFIATPINVNVTHWILVVVCYIHDLCECHRNEPKEISETAKPNRAKVIVLDSLNQRHEEIEMPLRPLLAKLCGLREGCGIDRGKVGKLPFYYPKVFQQPNPCDSGFYPALFLDTFMEQPKWYSEELSSAIPRDAETCKFLAPRDAQAFRQSTLTILDVYRYYYNLALEDISTG